MEAFKFRLPIRLSLMCGLLLGGFRAVGAESIETVEKAAGEWARVRAETARLESDWAWQKETMDASLTALKERVRKLDQRRELLEAEAAADAGKSGNLAAKTAAARQAMTEVEKRERIVVEKLVALRPWLPPRLSAALELPYRSAVDQALAPAERMQHAMVVFHRCTQFNKTVTYGEEVLTMADDPNPRLLEVIYWGVSHGYALDRVGHKAYFGHPTKEGWSWEAQPTIADAVSRLIEVHQEKLAPVFVEVPVELSDPFGEKPAK